MFGLRRSLRIATRFFASDSAGTAVEYTLVAGCVAVVASVGIALIQSGTERSLHKVSRSLAIEVTPPKTHAPDRRPASANEGPAAVGREPSQAAVPRAQLLALLLAASAVALLLGGRWWRQHKRTSTTTGAQSREGSVAAEQRIFDRRQRILRQLGSNTARLFQSRLNVSDLMSEDIAVVLPDTRRSDVVTRMRQSGVRHVYVCAGDGRLLGIIRDENLVRKSGGDASQFMDSNVPAIDVDAPVSQAVSTILNEHQAGLAVLEGGTLRGEITLIDLAIALQCFLQILLRMGQLIDSAVPADDEMLVKIADLHSTQKATLSALADQVKHLKDDDARGQWQQIHDEANMLVDSSHRLLKDVRRGVGDLEHRMHNLATIFDTRTDEMTGIGNARALEESLARQCALRRRYEQPVSLVLLRLEAANMPGFATNAGEYDERIRAWAVWLEGIVRDTDIVARYADQVFAVVLPHTDQDMACGFRDRLHKSLFARGLGSASAVIVEAEPNDTAQEMISRGEQLLEQTGGARNLLAARA